MAAVSFATGITSTSDQAKVKLYFYLAALAPLAALVLYVIVRSVCCLALCCLNGKPCAWRSLSFCLTRTHTPPCLLPLLVTPGTRSR
jgi:hypothetical protein